MEVAQAVGIEAKPLARIVKAAGIQAKNTTQKGITDQFYTFDLREKIEELLADEGDESG